MANVRDMGSPAKLGTKSITQNGTYNASSDNLDGFSQVSVEVPQATLGTKSITQNGTYNASADNLDGYNQVSVNVPEAVLGTKSITENGTYNASSDNLNGYSQVTVNVPITSDRFINESSRATQMKYYISSQNAYAYNASGDYTNISFPIVEGHRYMIFSGSSVSSSYGKCAIYSSDLVASPEAVSMYGTLLTLNSAGRWLLSDVAPYNGFIICSLGSGSSMRTCALYCMDVTGLDLDGSIS